MSNRNAADAAILLARAALWMAALTCWAAKAEATDAATGAIQSVTVVGTAFKVELDDGTVLSQEQLVGAVLQLGNAAGAVSAVRIDAFEEDPEDPTGEIVLYKLSVRDPLTGAWSSLCAPDADGLSRGFPLNGTWTPSGEHLPGQGAFSISCTSGASGKCVRLGYKPWKTSPDGISLWDYYQACTRMIRADYCGNGQSHTRNGTPIVVYDRLGIQDVEPLPGASFEAVWGPDGAVCVRRVRIPEEASFETLLRSCPERLMGNLGGPCTEERALELEKTFLGNRS